MILTVFQAAQEAETSISAILADIKAGHLPTLMRRDGSYGVDSDDLFCRYPPQRSAVPGGGRAPSSEMLDLRMTNADLRTQLAVLKLQLERERQRADTLIAERDQWAAIATARVA